MRHPHPADTDRPAPDGDARHADDRGRAHEPEMIGMGYHPHEVGLAAPPAEAQA
jgi:hypothetical protein